MVNRQSQGFSLMELLVVIAIISVLASILLPSLNKAKEFARQTTCSSNLRQIGLAWHIYLGEYKRTFPGFNDIWNMGSNFYAGPKLREILSGDSDNRDILQCPSDSGDCCVNFAGAGIRFSRVGTSYCVSDSLPSNKYDHSTIAERRLSNIPDPSITVLAGDQMNYFYWNSGEIVGTAFEFTKWHGEGSSGDPYSVILFVGGNVGKTIIENEDTTSNYTFDVAP